MNYRRISASAALLALALVLGFSPAARAEHINTLTLTGITWGYNASISFNHGSSRTVSTGEMQVTLNNFQDVIAYCVDLNQSIGFTSYNTYDMYPINQTMSTLQAGWLLGHYGPGLGYAHAGYSTAASITALQLAIWEVTYDYASTYDTTGSSTALSTGNFIAYNVANENSTVRSLALSYLASLPTQLAQLTLTGLGYGGVARSGSQQDLVVGANAVPGPGSMLLFGSAAGLLGWWRRRQARRTQA
ncbi:MAG: Cys-Gln thioester bond-forming surface protein [Desulfarculus sp.]|nr:Cys-Gln thioester bond-forming surface protein [Desulfarculus sp.]